MYIYMYVCVININTIYIYNYMLKYNSNYIYAYTCTQIYYNLKYRLGNNSKYMTLAELQKCYLYMLHIYVYIYISNNNTIYM